MESILNVLVCLVVSVSDGDTLTGLCVADGLNSTVKVRLAEVDAPEKNQRFGGQSKHSLIALCLGRQALVVPQSKDRYGRTVARVECDGLDASAEQAKRGMAWAYRKYLTDPAILELEQTARTEQRGLWVDANPVPPWDYRKN